MGRAPETGQMTGENSKISNVFCTETEFGAASNSANFRYYADSDARRDGLRRNSHFCE